MFSNDWRFLPAFLGPMRLGAVSVPLNIRMGDEALAYVVEDAEATVLVAGRDQAERARRLASQVKGLAHLVVDAPAADGAIEWDAWLAAASPRFRRRRLDPDSVCMQPYTSGSTGKPKGVLLAHRGQIWNADIIRKMACLDDTERALVAVPLYHKNAMIGAVKPFLLAGGSLVILPGFDPRRGHPRHRPPQGDLPHRRARHVQADARREGHPRPPQRPLDPLRALRLGRGARGAPGRVPAGVRGAHRRVLRADGGRAGARWRTRATGSRSSAPAASTSPTAGTASSRRVDGVTDCAVDEVGELVTRNPGLAKGFWKLPEVTAQKIRDGWLYTGDLMRRDRDGYYYFVGRKDDMINVAGENLYPKEVEDVLLRHPGLKDACVVSAPHATKGEVPVAYVVARDPRAAPGEEEVKRFFLERGAPYAHPRRVFFLDQLPLGGTGKLDRSALKRLAAQLPPLESQR